MVLRQLFSEPSFYFQFKFNPSLNLTKTVIPKTIIPSLLLYLPLSQNPSFLAVLANVDGEMRSFLGAAYWQLSGPGSFEVWPSGKLGEHGAPLGGVPLGLSSPLKALALGAMTNILYLKYFDYYLHQKISQTTKHRYCISFMSSDLEKSSIIP